MSHGATGKGNDQVRFELGYYALNPDIKIVAPWKVPEFYQRYPGRAQLIEYAQQNGIPVKATAEQPWSTDENLMHISFESGMLEDPWQEPKEEMFELSQSPKNAPDAVTKSLNSRYLWTASCQARPSSVETCLTAGQSRHC